MTDEFHRHVLDLPTDVAGLRLDQALARLLPEYSRSRLQGWIADGAVQVEEIGATSPVIRVQSAYRNLLDIIVARNILRQILLGLVIESYNKCCAMFFAKGDFSRGLADSIVPLLKRRFDRFN